ncbi:magnesium chelatase subunit H [Sandaracinobacteroides saxicola]|nr:magnesium chelatase subunit H [Sandaracinobacteroides saxicola]
MPGERAPCHVVIVTLDNHLAGAVERARMGFAGTHPGLTVGFHAAADWEDAAALAQAKADVARADIILVTMLFLEDHIRAILPELQARQADCDAMVALMSAGEVVRLTKMGAYRMDAPAKGPLALLKKLRGSGKPGASSGAGQMAMLRRLPKILRFIPGPAQDVRAYFLTLQYWLAGSDDNAGAMIAALVDRYADGPRKGWRGVLRVAAPVEYPEEGVYHPKLPGRISARAEALPVALPVKGGATGRVGLILLRSYILAKDAAHYDGVIAALEAKGLAVVPVFASGLDARPAIEKFLVKDGRPTVDAMVSLTGFSLVGGPAYNDSAAAAAMLDKLDVPLIAAHPLEFQTLEAWGASRQGLLPVEATMMVAIPELDGATNPHVFGGRSDCAGVACGGCARACVFESEGPARAMRACPERAGALAAKVAKLVALRRMARAERRVALVLFNFPPGTGAAGSAAFLSVFESAFNTLRAMRDAGYDVELPADVEALRERVLRGNAATFGAEANVHARVGADDIVAREPHLSAIEAEWGPAPGRVQADARHVHVLGAMFGKVFVGLQPGLGYEGDPVRLLFEGRFAPTHAFSSFYRWLREDFGADALLHFGTHGSLEFMPGKQAGMSADCWPERLIGDVPNIYLYAANNPSEGMLAKRRSGATLVSYLTPPVAAAGLTAGIEALKASVERWRRTDRQAPERDDLVEVIRDQAAAVDLEVDDIEALAGRIYEMERALIPQGLHVVGDVPDAAARAEMLAAMPADADRERAAALLAVDAELPALIRALDGGFVPPAVGGDLTRNPEMLPTGRNLHGFDPFRIPSAFALADGAAQATRLLERARADSGRMPETVAMVLWGTDNLKSEGAQLSQALALMGARPRHDSYGRMAGAELIPLAELGRPRVDVVAALSGIFRDLLPLQVRVLAEAAWLATQADEPLEWNFIRKHSLAHAAKHGCDLETAGLRVFSNAEGSYGANVNRLIDASLWSDPDELAVAFERQKSFAYGRTGAPARQTAIFGSAMAGVELAYQNLESIELGLTSVDQYVDTLGGISRSVARHGGAVAPVYIGDQTQGAGTVRSLNEQVALETRTRMLNPAWYEPMLKHGGEGVHAIETGVTATLGWSATTGQVSPWVYQRLSETFILDEGMRERLAALNPTAANRVANRLIEASERQFWAPDAATLAALHAAADALEDRLEGIS